MFDTRHGRWPPIRWRSPLALQCVKIQLERPDATAGERQNANVLGSLVRCRPYGVERVQASIDEHLALLSALKPTGTRMLPC